MEHVERLTVHTCQEVTALPGTGRWLALSAHTKGAVRLLGAESAEEKRKRIGYGGAKAFHYPVVQICGLPDERVALSDGSTVRVGRWAPGTTSWKSEAKWTMAEAGDTFAWTVHLAASRSGRKLAATSDGRLLVVDVASADAAPRRAPDGGELERGDHFWSVAFTEDENSLLVGRGDGRIELRDAETLAVRRTFSGFRGAILALAALDARRVAVADDYGRTALLDFETGEQTELATGGGKTSGLHRLSDGRLLRVGLSRQLDVLDGARLVGRVDLSEALGDRYVQSSSVLDGDHVVVACEQAGVHRVALRDAIHAGAAGMVGFASQVDIGEPKEELLDALLTKEPEEKEIRDAFHLFIRHGVLPAARFLHSPYERVRYYAANAYGELIEQAADRAEELRSSLEDPEPTVVFSAAWALGRIGDARAREWLTPVLRHEDYKVRVTTAQALLALDAADVVLEHIRGGAGELTLVLLGHRWPKLSPELGSPLGERARAVCTAPNALQALDGLPVDVDDEAASVLRDSTGQLVFHDGAPFHGGSAVFFVASSAMRETRVAATFEGGRLRLTGADRAASWWAEQLEPRPAGRPLT